jgi:hypothetical protein
MGFDARELTPLLVLKSQVTVAETRSFARAELVMREVAGVSVDAKTLERVTLDVGRELAERRDADPKSASALAPQPENGM